MLLIYGLGVAFLFWALFGNWEDGLFGDLGFNPTRERSFKIAFLWWCKNPFHNLTWHVPPFGFVGWSFKRIGKYPTDVFAPNDTWNYTILWLFYFIPLPFVSYQSPSAKGYIGWRERGNFGIKTNGRIAWIWLPISILVALKIYFKYFA